MSVTHCEREYSPDGSVRVIDDRRYLDVVAWQIESVKQQARDQILAAAPEHRQRNAALGLLTVAETDVIVSAISMARNKSAELQRAIAAVRWNGQEESRSAACDAVQRVTW